MSNFFLKIVNGLPRLSTFLSFLEEPEPSDPENGSGIIWLSNGTGAGLSGDLMAKIQVGSVTKKFTLLSFTRQTGFGRDGFGEGGFGE